MKQGISRGFCQTEHGAYSREVQLRYIDLRTREGQQLKSIIEDLEADLGGNDKLNGAQRVILGNIRGKLIFLLQVGKYVDEQASVLDSKGEALPCLRGLYLQYQDSMRRDLETLYGFSRKEKKPADLANWIKEHSK